MFSTSHPFLFFDYFRVPHTVSEPEAPNWLPTGVPLARASASTSGSLLLWPLPLSGPPAELRIGSTTIFASVVRDDLMRDWLAQTGREWRPLLTVDDKDGERVAAVWVDDRSNVVLPFDPAEVMTTFWSEAYRELGSGGASAAKALALRAYYRLRPLIPRSLQIMMRRAGANVQRRRRFPRWPIEPSLHEFYDILFDCLRLVAGEPVPWIASWPHGRSWALVLTHDVETAMGVEKLELLRNVEVERGLRSAWNFVPERYSTPDSLLGSLRSDGFEIGVHGLRHDGRDLESLETLRERAPAMRAYAERWSAVGFRSPATHRVWDWMPLLGFEYDSSSPDTDPYEPIPGGCCTWLPFFNRDLVELPITVVQDHTLFVILKQEDSSAWQQKCDYLRDRGGMAVLLTHPDYAGDRSPLERAYADLLDRYSDDPTAWHALPNEVADWWRRRGASSIEGSDGTWSVVGPAAAEATIAFAGR